MEHQVSRMEFLHLVIGLAAAEAVLEACSRDRTAAAPGTAVVGMCRTNGAKDGGINDPAHHLVVPAADIAAGVSKTYSIRGTQTHDHKVTLEAADFAKLGTDTPVTVTSTATLGHVHMFDVVCA